MAKGARKKAAARAAKGDNSSDGKLERREEEVNTHAEVQHDEQSAPPNADSDGAADRAERPDAAPAQTDTPERTAAPPSQTSESEALRAELEDVQRALSESHQAFAEQLVEIHTQHDREQQAAVERAVAEQREALATAEAAHAEALARAEAKRDEAQKAKRAESKRVSALRAHLQKRDESLAQATRELEQAYEEISVRARCRWANAVARCIART